MDLLSDGQNIGLRLFAILWSVVLTLSHERRRKENNVHYHY